MKNDRLEEFVTGHRDEFDIHTPPPEIWEKLNRRLPKQAKKSLPRRWISIAAALAIVLLGSGVVVRSLVFNRDGTRLGADANPEMRELLEAEAYYAQQIHGKLEEIRKCYRLNPELQEEVEDDLQELEHMYNELRKDLKENISNKEVIEAMIENNRFRLKLVDEVLEQINC
ncbi:hypothetical protein [Gaoshiqia sp. Z1-71]|uniref:hypothetical protein n=1 Tax=Gaoshiqia hydrogeniformans TaxID=3290090 RepID=UPI003BF811AE